MRKSKTLTEENEKEIEYNMLLAQKAKEKGQENQVLLASRKAARLQESNQKYADLQEKMTILYRVLSRMYANSEILLEDTKDQVKLKEQERKAIRTSYSAMKNAMDIISGSGSKREMFDAALENIADDLANKVGEMEHFMEMSASLMNSVDLQSGIFEEQGLKMLEEWEKNSSIMLMGGEDLLLKEGDEDPASSLKDRVKVKREKEDNDDSNRTNDQLSDSSPPQKESLIPFLKSYMGSDQDIFLRKGSAADFRNQADPRRRPARCWTEFPAAPDTRIPDKKG